MIARLRFGSGSHVARVSPWTSATVGRGAGSLGGWLATRAAHPAAPTQAAAPETSSKPNGARRARHSETQLATVALTSTTANVTPYAPV